MGRFNEIPIRSIHPSFSSRRPLRPPRRDVSPYPRLSESPRVVREADGPPWVPGRNLVRAAWATPPDSDSAARLFGMLEQPGVHARLDPSVTWIAKLIVNETE